MKPITQFEKRIRLVFGLVLAILFMTIAISIFTIKRLNNTFDDIINSHEIISNVDQAHMNFTVIRTSYRDYLLTRKEEYLAELSRSAVEIDRILVQIYTLTKNNNKQQQNVHNVRYYIYGYVREVKRIINHLQVGNIRRKQIVEFLDIPKQKALNAIAVFQEMRGEEGRLLIMRGKNTNSVVKQSYVILPSLLIVQMVMIIYLHRSILYQCDTTN